jgi:hypothetical protein
MNPRKRREAKAKVKSILQQKEEMKRTVVAVPVQESIKAVIEEPKVVVEVIEEVIAPPIEVETAATPVYTYSEVSTVVEVKVTSEMEYSSDGFEQEASEESVDDGECPIPTVEDAVCEPAAVEEEEEEPASSIELPEDPDSEEKSSKRSKKKAKKDKKAKE